MIPLRLRLNLNSQFYSPYPLHVVGLQAASMVKCPGVAFDPVEIFDAVRHAPRSVHRIVWALPLRAGEREGARVVMDKSLDSVHYADALIARHPQRVLTIRYEDFLSDQAAHAAARMRVLRHRIPAADARHREFVRGAAHLAHVRAVGVELLDVSD
ncbi:hypothetical protein A33K_17126 [Burkholderia humptydooensis MSMB43]|uniref:Sulfotransferase n=1 Tax=Burkholderia humptydooensis MSMB43 TaxID=441157 RepID=A0ABN0G1E8_9BURK|nr:hypothetical protein A33K_17126 [Burkholderia humptydooensis MSMB43]